MSRAVDEWHDTTPPSAVEMRAAELVERRDTDNWTDKDEAEFEAWLAESAAHRVAFLRLNSSWRRAERLSALRSPEDDRNFLDNPKSQSWRLKIAAVFGLSLMLGGAATLYFSIPRYDSYATAVGGHRTLTLHDGSKIEMNTDTLIRVSENTRQRLVQFDRGEAYFQIKHDTVHPFIVMAGQRRLIDLGTKFSVRADVDGLRVALVEGRVRVEATDGAGHPQQSVLSPGDVLRSSAGSLSVTKKSRIDFASALAWRQGMLVFHGTALADAAVEFNRYNETKVVISDANVGRETINGTLPSNDLQEFARMARNIFGLRTTKRGNVIVFAR